MVQSVAGLEAIKQLESFRALHVQVQEGARLEKTKDLSTSPGCIELSHPEQEVLWKDYQRIREWEEQNLLFQMKFEVTQVQASTSLTDVILFPHAREKRNTGAIPFVERIGRNGAMLEATSFIPKDTVVHNFSDAVEFVQTYQTVQTSRNRHVFGETLAKLNHSCEPSLIVDTVKRECRAVRDIQPGEELNFFYPSTEWTMQQPFSCTCSSAACIGQVQGAAFLEAVKLRKYWLNPHILSRKQSASTSPKLLGSLRQRVHRSMQLLRRSFPFDRRHRSSVTP